MKTELLFVAWPYISVGLLLVGIAVRFLLTRNHEAVIATEIQQARAVFGGSVIWKASLALLLAGHLAMLAFPSGVLAWNRSPVRLYLLEAVFFVIGLIAIVCCMRLVLRHVQRTSAPAAIEICDTVFWSLLFMSLLTGSLMAILYRWGSSWGAMTLSPYTLSLLRAKPKAGLVTQMSLLIRLHVFCAFSAIAAFPLTRLAAYAVRAAHFGASLAARPLVATGRQAESWLRRHNPGSWIWPEED